MLYAIPKAMIQRLDGTNQLHWALTSQDIFIQLIMNVTDETYTTIESLS